MLHDIQTLTPQLSRESVKAPKEALLNQHAKVVWMCGLSGAGKSTLAAGLENKLTEHGYLSQVLDGDVVRSGLNKDLGFSIQDRVENLRRIAEISRLLTGCGIITINAFISPTFKARELVRSIVGDADFIEVYVNAPLKTCEKRDAKGLYTLARQGLIKDFTGINSPFEPPVNPEVEIKTDLLTIEEGIQKLFDHLSPLIAYKR